MIRNSLLIVEDQTLNGYYINNITNIINLILIHIIYYINIIQFQTNLLWNMMFSAKVKRNRISASY